MNYGDHNFIEITQQTKLRIKPVELDFVERVDRLARRWAVRQCRCSQNAWARHVERVESSRVEPSGILAIAIRPIAVAYTLPIDDGIKITIKTIYSLNFKNNYIQVALYIGWRWRHLNDFIYVYRC